MNYIVFDLEFNQYYSHIKEDRKHTEPECPFEIIQIGAVKLDENLNTVSSFDRMVNPEIFDTIHPYVKKITGITMDQLKQAKPFKEIYSEFTTFIESSTGNNVLSVWGSADIRELFRNIRYHKLDTSPVPEMFINIQSHASKYFTYPKGTHIGLEDAVELLSIPSKDDFHNALNDAYYTAEIFKRIYDPEIKPEIKPEIYNFRENLKRLEIKKTRVNTYKLIKQFEKMYDREMTEEEKAIIKLAYKMGQTNQFQEPAKK